MSLGTILQRASVFLSEKWGWLCHLPGGTSGKEPASAGDLRDVGSIPGSGRSPGGEHGNPLLCCSLENRMDKGARRAPVYRVAKSWTQLKQLGMHAVKENIQEIEFIKNSKYAICIESRNSKRFSSVGSLQEKKKFSSPCQV